MQGCKGMWEGVIPFRKYDSCQGSVTDVRKACQSIEKCDAHGKSVQELGEV